MSILTARGKLGLKTLADVVRYAVRTGIAS
jgi:hypothetical protein